MTPRSIRFFRSVYRNRAARRAPPRPPVADLLRYVGNRVLEPVDRVLRARFRRPDLPIAFIVCVPRSGGTVFYQLLARFLDVGYINNRLARFWAAPIIGAWRHGNPNRDDIALASSYGRSGGPAGPHEFAWFWHHHGRFDDSDDLTEAQLRAVDGDAIRDALQGLAGYWNRPVVIKSIDYANYQIAWLKRQIPTAKFLWIERETEAVVASILRARATENQDPQAWWSTRPRDFAAWRDRPPEDQARHQVDDVYAAIARGVATLPPADVLRVSHESLVADPAKIIRKVAALLGARVRDEAALAALRLGA